MKKSQHNGFTMIEALLALIVSLLVAFLAVLCIETCKTMLFMPAYEQDRMAILQLRQTLAIANGYEVRDKDLIYIYNHEELRISYDRHRLVKQRGYEIIMENIDDAYFFNQADKVYLTYKKTNRTFTYQIL